MKVSSFLHFAGFGIKTILFRKKDPILGTVILTDFLMMAIYALLILCLGRRNPITFFRKIREGMLTSFSLCSSSAAMPTNMRICKEKLGIAQKIYSFSIPLGATVNMDGTCIILTIMGLFLAKIYGITMTGSMLFSLIITIILLSLGAPGVPGASIVCLGIVLNQTGAERLLGMGDMIFTRNDREEGTDRGGR